MATVTKSIGTSSRDYSTISAWSAQLDEGSIYSSGDTAVGECYNDTTFSVAGETDITEGGTIGLDTRTLSAAVGERHDGTADSGVRVLCTSTGSNIEFLTMDSSVGSAGGTGNQIQFLEIDCNEKQILAGVRLYSYSGIQNCIVHGARWCNSNNETVGIKSYSKNTWACNNIVYDIECDAGSSSSWGTSGIRIQQNDWEACVNNTVYGTKTNASVGLTYAYGIQITSGGSYQGIYNNISMGTASDNGTATDFVTQTSTTYTDANYSSDTSAPGDTNYRSQSASATFVSISAGSEDFHLLGSSNAVGVGKDAGTSGAMGHDNRRMPYSPYDWSRDINNGDRNGFAMAWDIGASQYEIIAKIGTSSRDFSTIIAWEAQLDNTDYYGKGSYAKGECYDDSDFEINGYINIDGGATVDLGRVVVSAAVGQRHDGTAKEVSGSGVRVKFTGGNAAFVINEARNAWVEWIDFDVNDQNVVYGYFPVNIAGGAVRPYQNGIAQCLVHNNAGSSADTGSHTVGIWAIGYGKFILNNIVYNITSNGNEDIYGIYSNNQDAVAIINNTVYNLYGQSGGSSNMDEVYGIQTGGTVNAQYSNNISVRMYGADDNYSFGTNAGSEPNNLSSDSTAAGTDCITGVDYNDLFVSTSAGAEDLHLKNGAPALRAGIDFGQHFVVWPGEAPYETNVPIAGNILNIDIDGRDRDSEGDDWDIGADQCESCSVGGAVTNTAFIFFVD